ncbi:MAG TPA: formate-dependent phosphoribosylglycinamide formyltransferase [Methanothermococcus okinawensis]|uniref:Formate-dependent phosphoribosylglycinamide formyltransferase n=1 Tax=Methanothermococcus okinawensis TaxID=155863 RepID=A0A832ZD74_9EURY|nr:formate-dependent phosphoribosylglycinamide formyltransferase [Methanothermococcus okinawensis]
MRVGTPLFSNATKILLLGGGELGKEIVIEGQRLGLECIVVDRYQHAPAMQVAHRSYVMDMRDGEGLKAIIERETPDYIIPEIEAIDTEVLVEMEEFGYKVVPSADATRITMNREYIRRLAWEKLRLKTADYRFAESLEELKEAVDQLGTPCVVKPVMSSSGKGQSIIWERGDIEEAWRHAKISARGVGSKVIVEEFIDFDYEITLLTAKNEESIKFCPPIGHVQIDGDYHESWQPHPMEEEVLRDAQRIAYEIVSVLGGRGIYGVELFIRGDEVIFSEVSPRPHDTGMVTMITQNMSQFEIHLRCLLGLPVDVEMFVPAGASHVIKSKIDKWAPQYDIGDALKVPNTKLRLFAKPLAKVGRRMGVALAYGESIEVARERARRCAHAVKIF